MARSTYNPAADIGKVRLLVGDTTPSTAVNTDLEIQAFLDMASQNLRLAAAIALDAAANNAAKLAKIVKLGTLGIDKSSVFKALIIAAEKMRRTASPSPYVSSSDSNFSMTNDGVPGTLDGI